MCLGLAQTPPITRAQSAWQNAVDIYVLFSGINVTVAVGPLESEMDVSFSELIENLDGGLLGAYKGENDQLAVGADMIFLRLKKEGISDSGLTAVQMTMSQLIAELHGMVRLTNHLEVFGGVRYGYIDTELAARVD